MVNCINMLGGSTPPPPPHIFFGQCEDSLGKNLLLNACICCVHCCLELCLRCNGWLHCRKEWGGGGGVAIPPLTKYGALAPCPPPPPHSHSCQYLHLLVQITSLPQLDLCMSAAAHICAFEAISKACIQAVCMIVHACKRAIANTASGAGEPLIPFND